MKIVNMSDFKKDWCWLRDEFLGHERGRGQEWHHYSSLDTKLPNIIVKKDSLSRAFAAWQALKCTKIGPSVLVSHGPQAAMYSGAIAKATAPSLPHLMYAFNFTNLPRGLRHKTMIRSFEQITKFVCFSSLERSLYSEYFEIPIDKIDMIHWSVHRPEVLETEDRVEPGEYICAIGSQGRDYATLMAAMKLIPNIRLVLVATKESIAGLILPENVILHTDIPFARVLNILMHSRFTVVPLRDLEVPCGHVTIVASMFLKKAVISTTSRGVSDYIVDEKTGVFCDAKNSKDLAEKISSLWEDASKAKLLGESGLIFATTHCTEQRAVAYFESFLGKYSSRG